MNLLRSRKFLLMLLDVVLSIALHFISKYAPQAVGDVNFLIVTLQPVFIAVIGGIAYEDAAMKTKVVSALELAQAIGEMDEAPADVTRAG